MGDRNVPDGVHVFYAMWRPVSFTNDDSGAARPTFLGGLPSGCGVSAALLLLLPFRPLVDALPPEVQECMNRMAEGCCASLPYMQAHMTSIGIELPGPGWAMILLQQLQFYLSTI